MSLEKELREAAGRVRRYVEMRATVPMRGLDDEIHGIHRGTEYEASLTLSDLLALLDCLEKMREALKKIVDEDSRIDATIRSDGRQRPVIYGHFADIARAALKD